MARTKFKWKLAIFCYLILVNVFTKSLPIDSRLPTTVTSETFFKNAEIPTIDYLLKSSIPRIEDKTTTTDISTSDEPTTVIPTPEEEITESLTAKSVSIVENSTDSVDGEHIDIILNATRNNLMRQNVRPGQTVREYAIQITPTGNTFTGRAVISVQLTFATREDDIVFHLSDNINVQSVTAGVFSETNVIRADFNHDDGLLEIQPQQIASSFILVIIYSGSLTNAGLGLYRGTFEENGDQDLVNVVWDALWPGGMTTCERQGAIALIRGGLCAASGLIWADDYKDFNNHKLNIFSGSDYLAMNLHPVNARRVFPCMDEPTESAIISFTFNDIEYNNIVANSALEENSLTQFRALEGPPQRWTMAAHNFNNVNVPTSNVLLYVRPGVANQESRASVAFNYYFTNLNEWTNKPYFEIQLNQSPQLSVLALPDIDVEWYGLSTIAIWEPYVLMENTCSVRQQYLGLIKMAKAMSQQWFGYVIYPENWRYEWVVSGLASYAAWDVLRGFQSSEFLDVTLLDVNTLFVTEVIQESLYRDGFSSAHIMEPGEDLFDEEDIRDNHNGILNYKAPALFRMMRLILGDESTDFIQLAGRALVTGRSLQTIDSSIFVDAINSEWTSNGNIDDVEEYLEPWTQNNGCPLIDVRLLQGGVLVTQERFGFSAQPQLNFPLPITYSVSTQHNFDSIYPITMMDGTMTFSMFLDDDDYVLFNVQGQGYYRVNYDNDLWERIIEALNDPDRREQIHPLNRATLIDDSLNLARAGRIDYDTAFQVVLAMEHETEYAPWRAFIRNMDFLRKRLTAAVEDDGDLDPDIYLRIVRRSIAAFEREIGFSPDPSLLEPAMVSLTRGMVMDHACRANYQPCIAAAVDWFWDNDVVNPQIPADLRPAVYCTMVREGGDNIIAALNERLEIEPSMYERVVILESLACSSDEGYVNNLLQQTIATNSPYTAEESLSIFKAAAASSYSNAWVALGFLNMRVPEIRARYGGPAKLEEAILVLAENLADFPQSNDFNIFVYAQNNRLEDSQDPAERIAAMVMENQSWANSFLESVYEWIDENDATTVMVSSLLLAASCMITLLNH